MSVENKNRTQRHIIQLPSLAAFFYSLGLRLVVLNPGVIYHCQREIWNQELFGRKITGLYMRHLLKHPRTRAG